MRAKSPVQQFRPEIAKLMKKHPWLAYENFEDFVYDAARRRLEELMKF